MPLQQQSRSESQFDAISGVNPYFFGLQPDQEFFETFGISGGSSVWTRHGICMLKTISFNDELMSRNFSFVRPVGVIKSTYTPKSTHAPESYLIGTGFFQASFPQGDMIIGAKTEIQVPLTASGSRRSSMSCFDMATHGRIFSGFRSTQPTLYVPVFHERTSIQVQGLCAVFPGLEDLEKSFKRKGSGETVH